jgi:peptidoglycan hydrolase CwlO-like protein
MVGATSSSVPDAAVAPKPAGPASRLLMPGANGPVIASSLPPVGPTEIPEVPMISPRSRMVAFDAAAFNASIAAAEPAPAKSSGGKTHSEEDYRRIKQENRELRKLLEEMKQLLQEASDNEQMSAAREAELQTQLAARQRQIDELTTQLQEIEAQVASGALTQAPPQPKTRTELEEWADELEREAAKINKGKRELDEERKQLREDEESLEKQMREMEVSMARERALMARQETELKRLSAEIQHELELMQRGDATLREQLSKFQRRATDVMQDRFGSTGPGSTSGKR